MNLLYVPKDPSKAYLADRLWLPKSQIRTEPVKRALEFLVNGKDQQGEVAQVKMSMWHETQHHLVCPREFIPASHYPRYKFPFIDLRPEFQKVVFEDHVVPRDEEQEKAWHALALNDNGILNLGCGKGKALAHGQNVLTARGFIPIEQVTMEDQVVGTNGRSYKVVGVFPQGERDIYRVSFTDGTHLDCDADHQWNFVLRRTRGKPTVTLTTKDLLQKPLQGAAGRLFYLPTIAPVEWQPGDLEVDPYTLGALLGDGHLSRPNIVEFTTMDGEMLSFMKLPPLHRFMVVTGRHSGRATTYRISMSYSDAQTQKESRLPVLLQKLGLMGHTAHYKFVPPLYKYSSSWDRLAVIQGLLDTDGSPTAAGAAEYATVSTQLADDMTDMVLSLGGTCTRQHRITTCNGKEFPSFRLLIKLPKGMPLFRLSRKLEKLPPSRQREPYRAVESVIFQGKGLATCISVDSPDHLFLAKDYIPTHNTRLALKKVAQKGVPTLVIVPDGGILEQWKESIYGNPDKGIVKGLSFEGEMGLIQGPVFNWAKPITLALVTTLWMRIDSGSVPEEVFRYFGLVIYDEVHQIGAPKFSLTASPFYGDRIGLTATVRREDGLDPIYRYHLGEPFYTDLQQDLIPKIFIQQTPTVMNSAESELNGTTNISLLRTALGRNKAGNIYRYHSIKAAVEAGRKVLCLSHSKDQLKLFHAMFPGSALIVGETDRTTRMDVLRDSNICFAIAKLGSTGVDDDRLDTLFWLTPFRSKIALQQSMGRIQRERPGKKDPIMIVFDDWMVPSFKRMLGSLKRSLKEWNYPYQIVKPMRVPDTLPPSVEEAYNIAFAALPARGEVVED